MPVHCRYATLNATKRACAHASTQLAMINWGAHEGVTSPLGGGDAIRNGKALAADCAKPVPFRTWFALARAGKHGRRQESYGIRRCY